MSLFIWRGAVCGATKEFSEKAFSLGFMESWIGRTGDCWPTLGFMPEVRGVKKLFLSHSFARSIVQVSCYDTRTT